MEKSVRFSTRIGDQTITLDVVIDFADVPTERILDWAVSNRIIALQRVLRAIGPERAAKFNGKTIRAVDAGKMPEDQHKIIRDAIAALRSIGEFDAAKKLEEKLKN